MVATVSFFSGRRTVLVDHFDSVAQNVIVRMADASDPKNRTERAEAGAIEVNATYDAKLAGFLTFVLGQYEDIVVEHLDRSRMPD